MRQTRQPFVVQLIFAFLFIFVFRLVIILFLFFHPSVYYDSFIHIFMLVQAQAHTSPVRHGNQKMLTILHEQK